MGSRLRVGDHDGDRSRIVDFLTDPLIRDAASHHAFFGRHILSNVCSLCLFCLFYDFWFFYVIDNLFNNRLCNNFFFFTTTK